MGISLRTTVLLLAAWIGPVSAGTPVPGQLEALPHDPAETRTADDLVDYTRAASFCPLGTYETKQQYVIVAIPDAPSILRIGPITFGAAQAAIFDVAVTTRLEHTATGDLVVTLVHEKPDGERRSVMLLNRAGVGPGELPGDALGCQGDLTYPGDYTFGTVGEDLVWEACATEIDHQCYRPEKGSFDIFDGLLKGEGEWYLELSDHSPNGDVGTFHSWAMHLSFSVPLSVETATWGQVKSLYQD